jgi:hypothetical protein
MNSHQSIAQSVIACMLTPTLPSNPEYMRATPGEPTPSLGKPGVVDDVGARVDKLLRPPRHPPANLAVVPGRGGDELLQLLMVHTQTGSHRLHRPALPIQQQPAQTQLALGPLIRPGQPAQHLGREHLQPRPDPRHLLRSHDPRQDHKRRRISGSDTPNKALLGSDRLNDSDPTEYKKAQL